MQNNYRGRLFKLFVVHTPMMLRALWKIAKGWMDPFTQEKIKVRAGKSKFKDDLDKWVVPEH